MVILAATENFVPILTSLHQAEHCPPDLLEGHPSVVCESPIELEQLLIPGYDGWSRYRRQVVEDGPRLDASRSVRHTGNGVITRPIQIIPSPTNLGLRPNESGQPVGTWRAAKVLLAHGLAERLRATTVAGPERLPYNFEPEPGSRVRNGQSVRQYSLVLATAVEASLSSGAFPLVVGGDCSNLLGCMLGLRRAGGRGLVHLDGHSDFFYPGNYDPNSRLGSVAGMDLAIVTGRCESIVTDWKGIAGPLVEDGDALQVGERERDDLDYPFAEILSTQIWQRTVQEVLGANLESTVLAVRDRLIQRQIDSAWLHIDLDVLDQTVMPAVDSPGSPGLDFESLKDLTRGFLSTGRIAGADVSIYDPDQDPNGKLAEQIVHWLAQIFETKTDPRLKGPLSIDM